MLDIIISVGIVVIQSFLVLLIYVLGMCLFLPYSDKDREPNEDVRALYNMQIRNLKVVSLIYIVVSSYMYF